MRPADCPTDVDVMLDIDDDALLRLAELLGELAADLWLDGAWDPDRVPEA